MTPLVQDGRRSSSLQPNLRWSGLPPWKHAEAGRGGPRLRRWPTVSTVRRGTPSGPGGAASAPTWSDPDEDRAGRLELVGPDGGIAPAETGEERPLDELAVSSCTRGLQMVMAGPADGVPGLDEVTPGEAMRAGCAA